MAQTALDRVKAALQGVTLGVIKGTTKTRDGRIVPNETHYLVQVDAADIAALTATAKKMEFADFAKQRGVDPTKLSDAQRTALTEAHAADGRTQIVQDLEMGQQPHKDYANAKRREVWIKADDAQHLIDQQSAV